MATTDRPGGGRQDVLTALPRTRPTRRSAKRGAVPGAAGEEATTSPQQAAATGGGRAPNAAAAGRGAAGAKAGAGGAKRGGSAKAESGAKGGKAPGVRARRPAAPGLAEPRRPTVPPAGYATPEPAEQPEPLRGGELITTAVEAVGELAQVGVTLGVQGVRSALRRLPRP